MTTVAGEMQQQQQSPSGGPQCIACAARLAPALTCAQGTVLRCPECGLGMLENIPEKAKIFTYYTKFYDEEHSERFHPVLEFAVTLFRLLRVRVVEAFAKGKGRLLDVGFGRPIDLALFAQRGWEVHGTQIVPHTVRVAQQRGLQAFLGELPDAKYPTESFDLITIWHVLEHLQEPGSYLADAHRILKPGGQLLIEVPNFGSPIAQTFGKAWLGLDLPHHLYHFTPQSLTKLLASHGFTVVKTKFFSLEQSPFSALQTLLNALTGQRNVVFEGMKTQGQKRPLLTTLGHVLLALGLAPVALLVSILFGLARQGDIMRFYCVRK